MKKKKSLIELAKEFPSRPKKRVNTDTNREELSVAWLKGDVTTRQVSLVLGYSAISGNVLYTIASNLKKAYENGLIKIVRK